MKSSSKTVVDEAGDFHVRQHKIVI